MNQEEAAVTKKVEELMTALDQVKKYRAFSRLLIDFVIIVLSSTVVLLFLELSVNFTRLATGFPCYYITPGSFTCGASLGVSQPAPIVQLLAGLLLILIPSGGLLIGIFWVDRKLRAVKVGAWRDSLKEGFPGALGLLQAMDWNTVFDDMRISKIGYAIYTLIKVIGYWLLTFIILFFPYGFGISVLHIGVNLYILALLSLILALVLTKSDLAKRYRQVVSLDTLLWELRWFDSEFRRAEFGKEASGNIRNQ